MPWPPEIQEAEARMNQAKAAVLADVESGQPYNSERRSSLPDSLQRAQAEFLDMVSHLHP